MSEALNRGDANELWTRVNEQDAFRVSATETLTRHTVILDSISKSLDSLQTQIKTDRADKKTSSWNLILVVVGSIATIGAAAAFYVTSAINNTTFPIVARVGTLEGQFSQGRVDIQRLQDTQVDNRVRRDAEVRDVEKRLDFLETYASLQREGASRDPFNGNRVQSTTPTP